jgi:hypothetical protein
VGCGLSPRVIMGMALSDGPSMLTRDSCAAALTWGLLLLLLLLLLLTCRMCRSAARGECQGCVRGGVAGSWRSTGSNCRCVVAGGDRGRGRGVNVGDWHRACPVAHIATARLWSAVFGGCWVYVRRGAAGSRWGNPGSRLLLASNADGDHLQGVSKKVAVISWRGVVPSTCAVLAVIPLQGCKWLWCVCFVYWRGAWVAPKPIK